MKTIIWVIIIIILAVGAYLIYKNSNGSVMPNTTVNNSTNNSTTTVNNTNTSSTTGATSSPQSATTKEFTVTADSHFTFSPKTLTVNKGDTVKITVKNSGGTHDFKLDEFNAGTRRLNAGESQTITFVADKSGTFEYYCSVGNHRAMGMVGTLTVK